MYQNFRYSVFCEWGTGAENESRCIIGASFREQPFVISRSAAEIDEAWDPKERVLVQGIIDAYFLEGDEIVLVDYKTDRVRGGKSRSWLICITLSWRIMLRHFIE